MTQQEFQNRFIYNPSTDRLGKGGFGEVFKAYDTYRDRWVAIKMAKVETDQESVRLRKEVELVNQLPAHPNIAYYEECYTFNSFAGEYDFGILQYYEAGNLQQLTENNNLTISQKEKLLQQLLDGIEFLHSQGVIHRDLKPQNILIVKRGNEYIPKITDFGISKKLDINKSSVFNNSLAGVGTLSFSSPEQLGDTTIRKNTDLWSFGVIAFWLLGGELPFNTGIHASTSEAGRAELFNQIAQGTLPPSINRINQPWRKLIVACLKTSPDERIKNVESCKSLLAGQNQGGEGTVIIQSPGSSGSSGQAQPPLVSPPMPELVEVPHQVNKKRTRILIGTYAISVVFALIFCGVGQNEPAEYYSTEEAVDSVVVVDEFYYADTVATIPPDEDAYAVVDSVAYAY